MIARLFACAVVACVAGCAFHDDARGTILCATTAACPHDLTCDVVHHICTAPGADVTGPAISTAKFSPAAVGRGVVTLTLSADENIAADPAPVLRFAGDASLHAPPAFALARGAGTTAVELDAAVDDVDEGFYALVSATVADAHGNVAESPLTAFLNVDRTGPSVDAINVIGGINGVFSDQSAPIHVELAVSEPLASDPVVRVGTAQLGCSVVSAGALDYDCAGVLVPLSVVDGNNPLSIEVSDIAGNTTRVDNLFVTVDARAPDVIAGTVRVTVDGGSGAASVHSVIALDLVFDDDIAGDPLVTLDAPDHPPFAVLDHTGRAYSFALTLGDVVTPGSWGIHAAATDPFGHATAPAVALALPAPYAGGIPVVDFPDSPCPASPGCPDVDGDGFFGVSPTCPRTALSDCDDGDPLTYPDAPEIFFDGKANDCHGSADGGPRGTDLFVSLDGIDIGSGTELDPVASLDQALTLAAGTSARIFIESGDYVISAAALTIDRAIVGGCDAAFTSTTGVSRFSGGGTITLVDHGAPYAIQGVLLPVAVNASADATLVDVDIVNVNVNTPLRIVRGVVHFGISFGGGAGGSRMIGTSVTGGVASASPDLFADNVGTFGNWVLGAGAAATIVNSALFENDPPPAISCQGCALLSLQFSEVLTRGPEAVEVLSGTLQPRIEVVASVIATEPGGTFVGENLDATALLVDNIIDTSGGNLLASTSANIPDSAAGLINLAQCGWIGCVQGTGNQDGTVDEQTDGRHLAGNPDASVARNAGPNASDAVLFGVNPAVAGDVDGQCRYDGGAPPNAGADDTP